MNCLITADLHLTELARDKHRWDIFPWLIKQVKKRGIETVFLLGDITDSKDRHPATLVNKFISNLISLATVCDVIIIKGNHDYIDENLPFFSFVELMGLPISFYSEPAAIYYDSILLLPHTRDYKQVWMPNLKHINKYELILTHQTFDGCVVENGSHLNGIPPSIFKGAKQVISGDIHVPQQIGKNITYVGAPYRIRFGDSYVPRIIQLHDWKLSDLHFPTRNKVLLEVRSYAEFDTAMDSVAANSQVKVRMKLKRSEFQEWPSIRKGIEDYFTYVDHQGIECLGIELTTRTNKQLQTEATEIAKMDPVTVVREYAINKKLKQSVSKAGINLVKGADNV